MRVDDLETALSGEGRNYDLLLAADTLVYLGDLAPLFAAAANRLVPGGVFLFTVERNDGAGYALGPKRRWRHSEAYLRVQAEAAGFDIAGLLECHPRTEAGVAVEGYAVALERHGWGTWAMMMLHAAGCVEKAQESEFPPDAQSRINIR